MEIKEENVRFKEQVFPFLKYITFKKNFLLILLYLLYNLDNLLYNLQLEITPPPPRIPLK